MDEKNQDVKLILEDGTVFQGNAFGAKKPVSGEVVFNTGMIGYPESLTDPSYFGQILVLTYPLIGNYGVPPRERENSLLKYFESEKIHIKGLVVTNYSEDYCHWNAEKSLSQWLEEYEIPGIYSVDTRKLTKKLRRNGTMFGKIIYDEDDTEVPEFKQYNAVKEVSIKKPITYKRGEKKVIIVDCGVKNSIVQASEEAGGVIISNGPGDPKQCKETIEHVKQAINKNIPLLGICLGSQILALSAGADTYKLKYGHRSQNQPCMEVGTNRCFVTSQNHGYVIDSETLKQDWREWFFNQNDHTNEGIIHMSRPFFGAQFHPEASPGPDDTEFIFDMFLRLL